MKTSTTVISTKVCKKCKKDKPIEEYYVYPSLPNGMATCKECIPKDGKIERKNADPRPPRIQIPEKTKEYNARHLKKRKKHHLEILHANDKYILGNYPTLGFKEISKNLGVPFQMVKKRVCDDLCIEKHVPEIKKRGNELLVLQVTLYAGKRKHRLIDARIASKAHRILGGGNVLIKEHVEGLQTSEVGISVGKECVVSKKGHFSFKVTLKERDEYVGKYILEDEDENGWWLNKTED